MVVVFHPVRGISRFTFFLSHITHRYYALADIIASGLVHLMRYLLQSAIEAGQKKKEHIRCRN